MEYTLKEKEAIAKEIELPQTKSYKRQSILTWFNGQVKRKSIVSHLSYVNEYVRAEYELREFIGECVDLATRKMDILISYTMIPKDKRPNPRNYLLNFYCLLAHGETYDNLLKDMLNNTMSAHKSATELIPGMKLQTYVPSEVIEFDRIVDINPVWKDYLSWLLKHKIEYAG